MTYLDIHGPNVFGAIIPDQPALCHDKVRYSGDTVAVVAADSEEEAELALAAINVEYEPLPVVTTSEEALMYDAPRIHEKGNIAHHVRYAKGNVHVAFETADLIVSETYHTPHQKHMYIETEAGFAIPTRKGVKVYAATQVPFQDKLQIRRALSLTENDLNVNAIDLGGGFGGKEEITIQIHWLCCNENQAARKINLDT